MDQRKWLEWADRLNDLSLKDLEEVGRMVKEIRKAKGKVCTVLGCKAVHTSLFDQMRLYCWGSRGAAPHQGGE